MRALLVVATAVLVACGSAPAVERAPVSYVPWAPLPAAHLDPMPPAQGTPPAVPPGTPYCMAGQLEGRLIGQYSNMSNPDTPIVLRNTSSSACYLKGFPNLTIADSYGRVLATVSGGSGTWTYYDSIVEPYEVLMRPDTGSLDGVANFRGGQGLLPGQAFFNVEWLGCERVRAATLRVGLPGESGRVSVAFDVTRDAPDVCSRTQPLMRGAFLATGISASPDRHLVKVDISISTPQTSVARGGTLDYFVTLTDRSSEVYRVTPCPDYWEAVIALKTADFAYQLNCAPAGTIASGGSVTFEMKVGIPLEVPAGPTTLLWALMDRRITSEDQSVSAPITVT